MIKHVYLVLQSYDYEPTTIHAVSLDLDTAKRECEKLLTDYSFDFEGWQETRDKDGNLISFVPISYGSPFHIDAMILAEATS